MQGRRNQGERSNDHFGAIHVLTPPGDWKRSAFNGLAQVIVQSIQRPGEIALKASSPGMASTELKLQAQETVLRPVVP
jgi:beta-galactosidase